MFEVENLGRESQYKLLVIDSISSFYWSQRMEEHAIHGGGCSKFISEDIVKVAGRVACIIIGGKASAPRILNTVKLNLSAPKFLTAPSNQLEALETTVNTSFGTSFRLLVSPFGCVM